ncbi:MAG: zonula occludens toxin [Campylobacter sp.]|uniref:zonular occludens toxin domain-containing protein n=1 Tax=Campylobacter sp. TaxID=205 RepID=UPI002AA73E99|nr:zonular occludens toxin domain-containing protein [Campylobacter sp.]MCI7501334.1 zonula occludens toxin [Campylobacter sp.]
MSIRYIVGNPGSGKSYYGVKVLYDAFIRPKYKSFFSVMPAIIKAYKNNEKHKSLDEILKDNEKKDNDYLVAYTNINEFKFELCEHIKKLDFLDLENKLTMLYTEYKNNKDSGDKELIELASELGLYKALFVIDEIHNFLDKDNEVLRWWLTYHRHLYQEMYLITQDLSLVSNEYKTIAEYFYKAVDSSKRFFSKKFRYIQYASYKLYQKDIISKFHVDFEQEIFNLYHSGNNGIGKSAVKKFMWIGILLALIVFILFKVLISVFLTPDEAENTDEVKSIKQDSNYTIKNTENSRIKKELEKLKENKDENFYYQFSCFNYQCSFKNSTDLFEQTLLEQMLNKSEILYKGSRTHTKGLVTWTYLVKGEVFKPLKIKYLNDERKKGITDEKDNFELGSFGFKP